MCQYKSVPPAREPSSNCPKEPMPRHICLQNVNCWIRRAPSAYRPPSFRVSRRVSSSSRVIHAKPTGKSSSNFSTSRAFAWTLSSLIAGGIAFYSGALIVEARKPCHNPAAADLSQQRDVSGRYDDTADNFDSEVGLSEFLMGINQMRKKLAQQCTGHVLEVSCGTGRNLGYYDIGRDASIESLTFVDMSPPMVEVCKKKWNVLFGSTLLPNTSVSQKVIKSGLVVRFLSASALRLMPPPPGKDKYDTIFQTMGLCSTPSPKALLLNMVKHLDTSNPEARILLLEHGRSYRNWLNNILDNNAEKHAEIHGCWFNRDIGAIVTAVASQTGLQVVSERRHHFGTTWIFELRPLPELVAKTNAVPSERKESPQPRSWRTWVGLK